MTEAVPSAVEQLGKICPFFVNMRDGKPVPPPRGDAEGRDGGRDGEQRAPRAAGTLGAEEDHALQKHDHHHHRKKRRRQDGRADRSPDRHLGDEAERAEDELDELGELDVLNEACGRAKRVLGQHTDEHSSPVAPRREWEEALFANLPELPQDCTLRALADAIIGREHRCSRDMTRAGRDLTAIDKMRPHNITPSDVAAVKRWVDIERADLDAARKLLDEVERTQMCAIQDKMDTMRLVATGDASPDKYAWIWSVLDRWESLVRARNERPSGVRAAAQMEEDAVARATVAEKLARESIDLAIAVAERVGVNLREREGVVLKRMQELDAMEARRYEKESYLIPEIARLVDRYAKKSNLLDETEEARERDRLTQLADARFESSYRKRVNYQHTEPYFCEIEEAHRELQRHQGFWEWWEGEECRRQRRLMQMHRESRAPAVEEARTAACTSSLAEGSALRAGEGTPGSSKRRKQLSSDRKNVTSLYKQTTDALELRGARLITSMHEWVDHCTTKTQYCPVFECTTCLARVDTTTVSQFLAHGLKGCACRVDSERELFVFLKQELGFDDAVCNDRRLNKAGIGRFDVSSAKRRIIVELDGKEHFKSVDVAERDCEKATHAVLSGIWVIRVLNKPDTMDHWVHWKGWLAHACALAASERGRGLRPRELTQPVAEYQDLKGLFQRMRSASSIASRLAGSSKSACRP